MVSTSSSDRSHTEYQIHVFSSVLLQLYIQLTARKEYQRLAPAVVPAVTKHRCKIEEGCTEERAFMPVFEQVKGIKKKNLFGYTMV